MSAADCLILHCLFGLLCILTMFLHHQHKENNGIMMNILAFTPTIYVTLTLLWALLFSTSPSVSGVSFLQIILENALSFISVFGWILAIILKLFLENQQIPKLENKHHVELDLFYILSMALSIYEIIDQMISGEPFVLNAYSISKIGRCLLITIVILVEALFSTLNCILFLVIVALLPVLLIIFGILMLPAVVEFMFSKLCCLKREYADGTSANLVNQASTAVIEGMLVFENNPLFDEVKSNFQTEYLSGPRKQIFHRLRQKLSLRSWFWPYWSDLSEGDICDAEFIHHSEPVSKKDVEVLIGKFEEEVFTDFSRPLWNLHIFDDFTSQEGRKCTAALLRIHHCIGDGFTLMRMILSTCEKSEITLKRPVADARGSLTNSSNTEATGRSGNKTRRTPSTPSVFSKLLLLLSAFKKLLLLPNDPQSVFKHGAYKEGDTANVAWYTLEHSVSDLKAIGKRVGCTINDILLYALSDSMHRWSEDVKRSTSPDGRPITRGSYVDVTPSREELLTCVWVSLAKLSDMVKSPEELPIQFGNSKLGALYMRLPIGEQDPVKSIRKIQHSISPLKKSPEPLLASYLLKLLGTLPRVVVRMLWPVLSNKVSLSMSNVPGPQYPMEFLGNPMDKFVFFSPPQDNIATFICIITFNDKITFSISVDDTVMTKAEADNLIHNYVNESITKLNVTFEHC